MRATEERENEASTDDCKLRERGPRAFLSRILFGFATEKDMFEAALGKKSGDRGDFCRRKRSRSRSRLNRRNQEERKGKEGELRLWC
jgi:hypothetical protein